MERNYIVLELKTVTVIETVDCITLNKPVDDVVCSLLTVGTYSVSQKNPPPLRFSEIFFPNGWEFSIIFYTPIV